MTKFAYITLLLNKKYLPGALALAQSLKATGVIYNIVLLYNSSSIDIQLINIIKKSSLFDEFIPFVANSIIKSKNQFNLSSLLKRSDLEETLTKLNLWSLIQFDQLLYLDSDILVVKNLDHLFEDFKLFDGDIVASPDCGWPDIFNSGVLLLKPSTDTFTKLIDFNYENDSFDGADQGLLNEFFNLHANENNSNWIRLPFSFNCTMNSNYEYLPAFNRFKNNIHVLHFIGSKKPWLHRECGNDSSLFKTNLVNKDKFQNLYESWWDCFNDIKIGDIDSIELLRLSGILQPRPKSLAINIINETTRNEENTVTQSEFFYRPKPTPIIPLPEFPKQEEIIHKHHKAQNTPSSSSVSTPTIISLDPHSVPLTSHIAPPSSNPSPCITPHNDLPLPKSLPHEDPFVEKLDTSRSPADIPKVDIHGWIPGTPSATRTFQPQHDIWYHPSPPQEDSQEEPLPTTEEKNEVTSNIPSTPPPLSSFGSSIDPTEEYVKSHPIFPWEMRLYGTPSTTEPDSNPQESSSSGELNTPSPLIASPRPTRNLPESPSAALFRSSSPPRPVVTRIFPTCHSLSALSSPLFTKLEGEVTDIDQIMELQSDDVNICSPKIGNINFPNSSSNSSNGSISSGDQQSIESAGSNPFSLKVNSNKFEIGSDERFNFENYLKEQEIEQGFIPETNRSKNGSPRSSSLSSRGSSSSRNKITLKSEAPLSTNSKNLTSTISTTDDSTITTISSLDSYHPLQKAVDKLLDGQNMGSKITDNSKPTVNPEKNIDSVKKLNDLGIKKFLSKNILRMNNETRAGSLNEAFSENSKTTGSSSSDRSQAQKPKALTKSADQIEKEEAKKQKKVSLPSELP